MWTLWQKKKKKKMEKKVDDGIFLNCDINGQTEHVYNNLLEQIGHINGQNFIELLDIYENFREFFNGFENEKMRKTKEAMNKLVKSEYVTKIEDKFPNIFRIDIILNSSLFERLQSLLANKSFSTVYRMEFNRLTMAFLIDRSFNLDLLLIGGGKGAHSSDRITANWREAMAEAIAAAYTDLGSEQNLCVLIKMNELAQLISKKRDGKGSEELLRDLRMDKLCEDGTERAKTMDKFVGAELGEMYTEAIERVVAYRREHFIAILKIPGAKTRLKQLVGSEQRMAEFASKNGLGENFREITLGRSDILWTHYQFVLLSEKGVSTGDSKLGADLCVFLFWLRTEFDQLKIGSIWPKIAQYFEIKIYDPIFDQNKSEMKETEQILIRIFVETKHFVKNLEKKGGKKSKNYGNNFKKWKEIIEGKRVKIENIEEKEMEEHLRWMKERHKKEFWKLIRGRELANFEKMFKMREETEEQMGQKLGNFFDENTSNEIITKFGGEKQKEKQIKKKEIEEENISGQNAIFGQNGDNFEEDKDNLSVVQCPPSNVPIEQLRAIDNDNQTAKDKGIRRETIDAFLAYLRRDETNLGQKEKQRHALEMKAYGMLWYEAVFLDNLVAFATDCAGDRSAGELFWMELEKLKKQWEELMDGSESKWGKLLLLFEFGKHFVNNKILWENSERWQKRLISEKMVELGETKRTENWVKPKFDEEKAKEYFFTFLQLYGSKSDTNYMIFFAICDLIDVSLEVRRFFCDSSDSKAMQKVKIRVGQIMDKEYLIQLDEMYPEILQIDLLLPWTQTVLYKRLLATKSGTDQHLRIECRFALPVLFHRLKWLIVKTPTLKGKVLALFREKLQKVQRIAFRGLRRELVGIRQTELMREELLKSVCILQRFYEFASAISALSNGAKEMPTEEEIRNWNTERNCMTEEGLIRAYQDAHLSLIQTHGRQLTIFFRTNVQSLREFVREKRGAKTRIRKLVNGQERFMDEFRMELRDRNLFSNWRLMDDYLDAFFDLSKATRVVGNLSVFISVWVRWMDHQFWTDNSLGQKPMEELQKNRLNWTEMRSFFEDLYDELVDVANFDELEQKSDLLRELQRRIWEDFVGEKDRKRHPLMREKQRDGKSANEQKQQKGSTALSLGRKWSKYRIKWANLLTQWQRLVRDAQQKARGVQMMEKEGEYEQWIDGIHWDTLINLLSEDGGKFRESLKNGFVRDAMAKARLKDFLNWEMVEKLMQLLAREDAEEFKKELELIRQREGWREREIEESEEEVERKSREERALADQKMHELIREEEHIKELKRKMEERQEATFVIEGMENCEENAKREEKSDKLKSEREKMTKHLNRNKLLKTIATKESANESWHKLSETERNEVLSIMFRKKANLTSRFNELLEDWTAKVKQQRIDKNSYGQFEKYANDDGSEMSYFALKFIENSQQIYLNCHNVRRQEEECYEFLKENGQTEELSENGALIEQVKAIVEEWVGFICGSSLLGAATADSDIDLICIVPQRMALNEQKETFYGKDSSCDLARPLEERFCEDKSLYCHFCKNVNVLSLFKIPFAQIPLLQLKFAGKDFDITFVAVPFIERLPDDALDGADVEAFLEVIASRGKAYEAMHKSLTSE
ncbi:hypothetical protein niasHT_034852 [Heterodera trifolii]|uniref:Polymerase nucleotidyl transferase domain-containing protein n=1 Tax=Heterodera trifolii TaxID=157864 RepID=A0ABD2IHV2_9BILA